jgi:regulator of protease activity HflC (stomatin/prohibitin superfamily)
MSDQNNYSHSNYPQPPNLPKGDFGSAGGPDKPAWKRPARPPFRRSANWIQKIVTVGLVLAVGYGLYVWEVCRVVVDPNHVLVLLKKNGSKSLPGDNVIIPRPPDPKDPDYAAKMKTWQGTYGDCNGILEQVYPEGTYFQFSPFDYEREVIAIDQSAIIPAGKLGIVIKKFGQRLDTDSDGRCTQILADPARDQRGPLPIILNPGRYNEYANPYAYEIKQVDPLQINPGYRGVVTVVAGAAPKDPDQFLVNSGEQGVQRQTEPEGFRYINPFIERVTPISTVSQRFEMTGDDVIHFPSADSFDIQLEGFVEWSIDPDKLPLVYVQYANGGDLIPFLEEGVILPYARSFCRLAGSQYDARDFISGDTKLKFQQDFEQELRAACAKQGIVVHQALVRNIIPPDAIKEPINEREVAREQIIQYEQQIKVAQSQALLATQQETATQNNAIGDANAGVVKVINAAQQAHDVAVTEAQQRLEVAKLELAAAQRQADAITARGQAEANVTLLKKQAEAEPLRQTVSAFGDGEAYARFIFNQRVAPSIKSILTNTDGPLADLFKQFTTAPAAKPTDTASQNLAHAGK